MKQKLRMGMVGGGIGAFIGGVHRMAAALDGEIDLVCGAFSSNPEKSRASGAELGLMPERCYGTFEEMIQTEKTLPADKRMQVVSVVTPNHMHFAPSKMALENGFHVICDKPLAFSLAEAEALAKVVRDTGMVFTLTHNYTAYPMVKQARQMVKHGEFGAIRKVVVEYPQGWLSTNLEASGQKQAAWRTDPSRSGIAGSMGDIGTHAENLAEYITGLKITELCADISIFVPGRQLDDDGNVLLHFDNGAKGILHASQICAGEENNLNIRVYGEKGSLQWSQMEPNSLIVRWLDKPMQVYRTGFGSLYPESAAHTRVPAGHPEGYLEAFASIYRNFAFAVKARLEGKDPDPLYDFPTVEDGVRGMRFIEKVIESGKAKEKWVKF
jgi:predicted dehydrogenase